MTTPQYQFNLNPSDPILNRVGYVPQDYYKNIDDEIKYLNEMKQRLNQVQTQPQNQKRISLWDEIDTEVSSLTNEQKKILGQDEVYISIDRELQGMVQQELINLVKPNIENSSIGKELLEKQLTNIRNKKNQIVEEANKELELFKKFQIAVQANPNLTYVEFIKNIK